jgi:hypothetical protein
MPQRDEPPFDGLDLHAVNHAMLNMEAEAKSREERMPSSAEAMRRFAARLRIVREKLLNRLPDERKNYP